MNGLSRRGVSVCWRVCARSIQGDGTNDDWILMAEHHTLRSRGQSLASMVGLTLEGSIWKSAFLCSSYQVKNNARTSACHEVWEAIKQRTRSARAIGALRGPCLCLLNPIETWNTPQLCRSWCFFCLRVCLSVWKKVERQHARLVGSPKKKKARGSSVDEPSETRAFFLMYVSHKNG